MWPPKWTSPPQETFCHFERHSPEWKSRYWWQAILFCALPRSCQPMAPFSGKTQLKASQLLSVPYPVFHKHLTVCRCTSLSRSHRVGPRPMCAALAPKVGFILPYRPATVENSPRTRPVWSFPALSRFCPYPSQLSVPVLPQISFSRPLSSPSFTA